MGDPRKNQKKYTTPRHPWQKVRIDEERELLTEYGLKNKKDLWKMTSRLARFKKQAKTLISRKDEQGLMEKELFMNKLQKLNLINVDATLDDVLDLSVKDLLERRLQTILFRKGHAKSVKQSRQMIVHEHVLINGQKMNVPSFLVPISIENSIDFHPQSPFIDPDHPERKVEEMVPVVEETKEVKKEEPVKVEKTKEVKKEEPVKVEKTKEVKKEEPVKVEEAKAK